MYHPDPAYDARPSQFRRPWSPEPYDPLPRSSGGRSNPPHSDPFRRRDYDYDAYDPYDFPARRREPSDVSVEALDLADYRMTLRSLEHMSHGMYPPTHRPLAARMPTSMSRGDTLSSNTHTNSGGRNTTRRPFSLPPPSVQSHSTRNSHPASPRSANNHNHPYLQPPRNSSPALDTAHFPAWSRNWYNTNNPGTAGSRSSIPTPVSPPDMYTPLPHSSWGSKRTFEEDGVDPFTDSSRDYLPWSSEPPEYGPIDPALKEERMRMLEREFGTSSRNQDSSKPTAASNGEFLDADGKPLVGTVNAKGQLVTKGPKKRIALRALQIVLAGVAAVPSIYAAALIKPTPAAPPAGTASAYVLYAFSAIFVLLLLWLFAFRPCCCAGKRRKPAGPAANGMMVLPVTTQNGKKGRKPKKGKHGKHGPPAAGDVQVNLIVDPNAFGRPDDLDDDSDDEYDDELGSVPGGYDPGAARRKRRKARRRSVFAGLAMEEAWKHARSWAKTITAVDSVGFLVWGAVFVFVMIGKRCPSGGFQGWCNAYNVSTAAACLLWFSFGIAIFFDIQDLSGSKQSPRTRT
ncbi:unnamed protein product [Mycena citricolor]|uniref:Uncharacterized protein n=1 Tax=Mycena citricolor TaxID=2018698 RepID=A0AAD2HM41_9AGAR|nr:unnamed protein product [Mycena citricolor]CAK5264943.1 unnamed protein product [Mycena citricolor]CAK5277355.1 unnamed protein product [Mycena citricolor]